MRVCECLRLCCVIRKKTYNLERMEYQVEKHIRMNKKIYIYILGADRVDELGAFRSLYDVYGESGRSAFAGSLLEGLALAHPLAIDFTFSVSSSAGGSLLEGMAARSCSIGSSGAVVSAITSTTLQ